MKTQIKQYNPQDDGWMEDFTQMLLEAMPEENKNSLRKALQRNMHFTSAWVLEFGTLTVYKEGWYIDLRGCQSSYKVFILDNDRFDETGDVPFRVIRKPHDSKLNPLYQTSLHLDEGHFDNI